jgi:hypothetical protein
MALALWANVKFVQFVYPDELCHVAFGSLQ